MSAGIAIAMYGLFAVEPLPSGAFATGIAVFLAWAIGRELDPDHNTAAAAGMVVAFGASFFAAPSLLLATGTLLATRLIAGTVGIQFRPIDKLALLGIGGCLGLTVVSVAAIPALMAGIVINEQWRRESFMLAFATGSAGALTLAFRQPEITWTNPGALALAATAVVLLSLSLILPATPPAASPDLGSGALSRWRISGARLGAAATVVVAFAAAGNAGIAQSIGIAGAAIIGTAIVKSQRGKRPHDSAGSV